MKAAIEALLATISPRGSFTCKAEAQSALHPGQAATIYDTKGEKIGCIGALHPQIEDQLGLSQRVCVYELALKCFERAEIPHF